MVTCRFEYNLLERCSVCTNNYTTLYIYANDILDQA